MSGLLVLIIIILALAIAAFEIWMFVHAIINKRLAVTNKILWIVFMLLIHPFVAIAYYFIEYNKSA